MSHVADANPIPLEAERIAGLPFEEVARRLRAASQQMEWSDRVLAFLLVEMDGGRMYLSTGHQSTEDYAEARLEMDRQRAVELLRVGRTLCEQPDLDRASCAGRIRWSTVLRVAGVSASEEVAFARFRRTKPLGNPLDAPSVRARASRA